MTHILTFLDVRFPLGKSSGGGKSYIAIFALIQFPMSVFYGKTDLGTSPKFSRALFSSREEVDTHKFNGKKICPSTPHKDECKQALSHFFSTS